MKKDTLGDRMKNNYESRARTFLTRRMPVILRLDGKAFHTFTRGCNKPFDEEIIETMATTAQYLVDSIQGARLSYTQSDEISILLCDYDRLETNAWFDYNVQKMCSVAASMASAIFNDIYKGNQLAFFDCRAFNIPREEVSNYFFWRWQDWVRNSISMAAQAKFSQKKLHGKAQPDMLRMLLDVGIDYDTTYNEREKYGTFYTLSKYFQGSAWECDACVNLRQDRWWIDHLVAWTVEWQEEMNNV